MFCRLAHWLQFLCCRYVITIWWKYNSSWHVTYDVFCYNRIQMCVCMCISTCMCVSVHSYRWLTCACGRSWSRAVPTFRRSSHAPSPWCWWCPAYETETRSQSSWLPSPGRPRQEMPPGTPAHLRERYECIREEVVSSHLSSTPFAQTRIWGLPSLCSTMTVWQRESSLKNSLASLSFPDRMLATREWSMNWNFLSASRFQLQSTG